MKTAILVPLVVLAALAAPVPARATPITWAFTGVVDGVGDPNHQLDGSVVAGTPFSGTYTFESTMTDDLPDDPFYGIYTQPCPPTSVMVLDVGNYHVVGRSDLVRVTNFGKDGLSLLSYSFLSDPFGLEQMALALADLSGKAFSSDALPLIPPPLELFDSRKLGVEGVYTPQGNFGIGGSILSLILVPEPASVCLALAGGLACLIPRMRRRTRF